MASEIRVRLLKLVLDNPEIKRDDIHAHKEFREEEDRTLASLLYNAKKDEQLVADEGGHYTITAKGRQYLKDAGIALTEPVGKKNAPRAEPVVPPPSPGRRDGKVRRPAGGPPPPPDAHAAARGIADKLMHQAQAALDEYVASVCDPEILNRFKAARDSARDLVSSFEGAGGGAEGGECG